MEGRAIQPKVKEGVGAGIEEVDFECALGRIALTDELIEALFGDGAVSLLVRIDTVSSMLVDLCDRLRSLLTAGNQGVRRSHGRSRETSPSS